MGGVRTGLHAFHDDDCGVTLVNGVCPECKFAPDMQSVGLRPAECGWCGHAPHGNDHCEKMLVNRMDCRSFEPCGCNWAYRCESPCGECDTCIGK